MAGEQPLVSVIIPTYNEERFIGRCLESIYNQDYPKDKIEIVVVDNGSIDNTLQIIKEFSKEKIKVILLHNNIAKNSDISKAIGLKKSKGDLVYYGDADVILHDKDWMVSMVLPFKKETKIFASECGWGYLKDFPTISKYCALLGIADPLGRMLTNKKGEQISKNRNYELVRFTEQNPVLYCVMWNGIALRKNFLNRDSFAESNAPMEIIKLGYDKLALINKVKAYHYYAESLFDFIKKRKKIARKYLARREKGENTWVEKGGNLKLYLATLYCFSIILPLLEGIKNTIRDKEVAWLWHPVACFVTAWIYSWEFLRFGFGRK